ncbi:zinc metalloprotease [Crocinitomix catalasitica]|nr:zinc metalloprotease [Crocinitomix catalasitica]
MKIILLTTAGLFFWPVYSQEIPKCGTAALLESEEGKAFYDNLNSIVQYQLEETEASLASGDRATLIIPVVFHIVYNAAIENIDDSLIYQQIQILNDDFQRMNADTVNTPAAFKPLAGSMDVTFCLAQQDPSGQPTDGILRIPTTEVSFASVTNYAIPDPVKHTSTGGSDAWDTQNYLNFWSCNLTGASAYSAAPGNFVDPADDGVVSHYEFFGLSGAAWPSGRTCVHEVGHFFGLKHIWGDDGGACTGTDFMADTPNQADWTGGCPVFPVTDACTATSPGIMFMNYMDYSGDDCKNMFTVGQTTYMLAVYNAIMPTYFLVDKCTNVVGIEESESIFEFIPATVVRSMNSIIVQATYPMKTINVHDYLGRLMGRVELNGETTYALVGVISNWNNPSGVYIIEIIYQDLDHVQKIRQFIE